jgi:hypothetical protein
MPLTQIVLQLARNPGYPDGDAGQGYILVAPLDADGKLDPKAWREARAACTVIRFKPGEERDADGRLMHRGADWFFHYDEAREGVDEPVFRLGDHRLLMGDYVTIHENDGQSLTYRVTQHLAVRPPTTRSIKETVR